MNKGLEGKDRYVPLIWGSILHLVFHFIEKLCVTPCKILHIVNIYVMPTERITLNEIEVSTRIGTISVRSCAYLSCSAFDDLEIELLGVKC